MIHRMNNILRFWVECQCENRKETDPTGKRSQHLAQILMEFEEAGDAMRYLNRDGQIAWRATPRMLRNLADAERAAEDDLADVQ